MTFTAPYFQYTDYYAFVNLFEQQVEIHANTVFARYLAVRNGSSTFLSLTYRQVDHLATNLACQWHPYLHKADVVGFIADHNIFYLISLVAILKLRVTFLSLSPRNLEADVVGLLHKTHAQVVMATEKYRHVATGAASQTEHCEVIILPPFDLEKMLQEPLHPKADTLLNKHYTFDDIEKIAIIFHSSGSTSYPKPIQLSNRYLILLLQYLRYRIQESAPTLTYDDRDTVLCASALFHLSGFISSFMGMLVGASTVLVATVPASVDEVRLAITETNPTMMGTNPLVLEKLLFYMTEHQDFELMQRLKLVFCGGGPLKSSFGEELTQHHINIKNCYGTTEISVVLCSDFDPSNKQWNVLRGTPIYAPYYQFEPCDTDDPTVKHLVIPANAPFLATGVANREDGGYNTNDIFREVTPNSGDYIYVGRKNDVFVMQNGEKTNPVPMENVITGERVIKQCAVIGERRPCTCVLVELRPEYLSNSLTDEVMQRVRRAVNRANKEAPSHSIIHPQMIKILPPGGQIPLSDKGTIKRQAVVDEYSDIIAELYDDFLNQNSNCTAAEKNGMDWPKQRIASYLVDSAAEMLDLTVSELSQ
ncbi:uncharacterized protein BYT42DRAFT_543878 [Radiomyces spectabilis]|uniref:uncharacterized protein n=1 Tax=Radiomyces spectabilis TaxID=64574 RepID=UPI00221EB9E9|nr:uncharacterized protein BYT42DRAFT_543878 [Radiomyces spectabilis]KAI8388610.1 hypothetical protein BYT42DRAFT_543878 [Radiomyces spectabilis]